MRAVVVRALAGTVTVLTLVCAAWTRADAQGMYYKEIRKDDRIYVFNNAEEADRFEKSGEMGRALTRPGAGPKGETVVADSERALELFFFKHEISEPVAQPVQPVQRIEWRDGKTRITTDNAYLEISNRVQVRFTHEDPNDQVTLPGTGAAGDGKGSFRIRRAKFKLEGWFWKRDNLFYEVQMNWPGAVGSNVGAFLEDAVIVWDPKGKGAFRILFGQYKVPFGRQELTSSGNQQFVDRSLVSNSFARGRDTGVGVQGVLFNNKLEYRAGVFNGAGLTRPTNDNAKFQYNARLMWQPNGSQPLAQRAWVSGALYSEGDFESTSTPIYAFGLNYEHNDFHFTTTTPANNLKSDIVGVDGVFKFKGFSTTGEYFWRQREREVATEQGTKFDSNGGYLQAGMMLDRRRTWEAVVRYGEWEPSDLVSDDDILELRGGINYYYRRHGLKFQADVGQVETNIGVDRPTQKLFEFRAQTQFIF